MYFLCFLYSWIIWGLLVIKFCFSSYFLFLFYRFLFFQPCFLLTTIGIESLCTPTSTFIQHHNHTTATATNSITTIINAINLPRPPKQKAKSWGHHVLLYRFHFDLFYPFIVGGPLILSFGGPATGSKAGSTLDRVSLGFTGFLIFWGWFRRFKAVLRFSVLLCSFPWRYPGWGGIGNVFKREISVW